MSETATAHTSGQMTDVAKSSQSERCSEKKEAFLLAFAKKLTVLRACETLKLPRTTFQSWKSEDPEFNQRFQAARADVFDKVRELAFSEIGLIPGKKPSKKWVNHTLIMQLLRQDPEVREEERSTTLMTPQPMPIKGIELNVLMQILQPQDAGQGKVAEIKMVGAEIKAKPKFLAPPDEAPEAQGDE